MESTRLINNVNVACDWVVKLFYVNLLWVLFTLAGLIIAGVFPATAAMFTVMKGYRASGNVSAFSLFKKVYKEEFSKANQLGIVLLIIPVIFYIDWLFTSYLSGTMEMVAKGILLGSTCLYGITLLYVFPVYLLNRKVFTSIKMAFLIGITYPLNTFMMLSSIASLFFLVVFLPMAGYLFLVSGLACIVTFYSLRIFQKIEIQEGDIQKQRKSRWVMNN